MEERKCNKHYCGITGWKDHSKSRPFTAVSASGKDWGIKEGPFYVAKCHSEKVARALASMLNEWQQWRDLAPRWIPVGERLPPIRQLAGDLGLAANTVAKAYKELEADGFVASNGRRGTVVLDPVEAAPEPVARQAADDFAATVRRLGLDPAAALALVTDALAR